MKTIELHFWHNGDRSVGIDGDQASVTLNVGGFSASDEQEHIKRATELLRGAFGELWDARVSSATADELACADPTEAD